MLKKIEELLELEKKATPGEWKVCEKAPNDQWYEGGTIYSELQGTRVCDVASLSQYKKHDAELICKARNMARPMGDYIIKQDIALRNARSILTDICNGEEVDIDDARNHLEIIQGR